MTYTYPLAAKVISEFVAMCLTIFMGESILANELLPSTKGHGMGLLAVAIGFGLAFGVNIAWFGIISAHINPAMFFFLALIGKVSWKECICCSLADMAGAFVGAVLVVIFFLPHFGFALPLLSDVSKTATFLEGHASLEKDAGRFASAFGPASRQREGDTLGGEIRNFFTLPDADHFRKISSRVSDTSDPESKALLEKMKVTHKRRVAATNFGSGSHLQYYDPLNNSVHVATLLHAHDTQLSTADDLDISRHSVQVAALLHTHDPSIMGKSSEKQLLSKSAPPRHVDNGIEVGEEVSPEDAKSGKDLEAEAEVKTKPDPEAEKAAHAAHAAYKAAIQADASAKLSIFATRPAIFDRPYNYVQEAMLTAVLVLGAELFSLRRDMETELKGGPFADGPFLSSLYVSFFITMLILGLGGPTGLAANPARDLGPRLVHQLLPIRGKGSSEWNYGLVVPLFGPLTGSLIGAAIYKGLWALFHMAEIEEDAGAGVEL